MENFLASADEGTQISNEILIDFSPRLADFCEQILNGRPATPGQIQLVEANIEKFFKFKFSTFRAGFSPFENENVNEILAVYQAVV